MSRRKSPETLLKEAVESDDNLAILKAHRAILTRDLCSADELSDRVKISSSLAQVNNQILKLEGAKKKEDSVKKQNLDEYEDFIKRSNA